MAEGLFGPGGASLHGKAEEDDAIDRRNLYAKRFDVVGRAWASTLRLLRMRQSIGHAFRIPALYSTAHAGMSAQIGRAQFLSAMTYAFEPNTSVIDMVALGKLYKKLFHVFDVEGIGVVDYREFLCVLAFFQERWDITPEELVMRWFRHYDGHIEGLTKADFLKVVLTLAVTPEEAADVMRTVDSSAIDAAMLSAAGTDVRSSLVSAENEPPVALPLMAAPEVDMYAGIPVGSHGEAARPSEARRAAPQLGLVTRLGAREAEQQAAARPAGGVPHLRSPAVRDGPFPGGMLPPVSPMGRRPEAVVVIPSESALARARREARDVADDTQERKAMDEMAFMAEIRRRRANLKAQRRVLRTGRVTSRAMPIILSRSPAMLRAIHRLRIVRAPPPVRARIIRERMVKEIRDVEDTFAQVSTQISLKNAVSFWKRQMSKRWLAAWVEFVTEQKTRRLKIWRFRVRVCVRWWCVVLRRSRVRRQQMRVASVHGYMVLQRRAFARVKLWYRVTKELRHIQFHRAQEAYRLRLLESVMDEWQVAVRSDKMMRKYSTKLCSSVLLAWRRLSALSKHQRQVVEAARAVSGLDIQSLDEIRAAEQAIMQRNAEDLAEKMHEEMEIRGFFDEAGQIADVEATVGEEAAAKDEAARRERNARAREALRQAAMRRHEAWLAGLRKREQAALKQARACARACASARMRDVVASRADWSSEVEHPGDADGDREALTAGYEAVAAPVCSVVSEAVSLLPDGARAAVAAAAAQGDVASHHIPAEASRVLQRPVQESEQLAVSRAMRVIAGAEDADSLRQGGSDWVPELDGSGAVVGFLRSQSNERRRLADASALDILDIAASHLIAACEASILRAERGRQAEAVARCAQERVALMLGNAYRSWKSRQRMLAPIHDMVEQLVDPYTGDVYFVNRLTRAPLHRKPAMLGDRPVRELPDWVLRVDEATGLHYYANREQGWRTRSDPPKGRVLCFVCQAQIADRRCLGEGCDGYLYCWDCWSSYHPVGDERYCHHEVRRQLHKRLTCGLCAEKTARFIVWQPPYDLVCTECKASRVGDEAATSAF